jgi:hypothetical protein
MKLEKKNSLNWKKYPVGFKLGKKSSSSNSIFQTGELEKTSSDRGCCRLQAVYSPITVKNFVSVYTAFNPCNRGNLLLRLHEIL